MMRAYEDRYVFLYFGTDFNQEEFKHLAIFASLAVEQNFEIHWKLLRIISIKLDNKSCKAASLSALK